LKIERRNKRHQPLSDAAHQQANGAVTENRDQEKRQIDHWARGSSLIRNETPERDSERHSQERLAARAQHLGDFLIEKQRYHHRQSQEDRCAAVIDGLALRSGYRYRTSGNEAECHADQARHE
jgi:hypothetical protein